MSQTFTYPSDETKPLAASRAKMVRVRELIFDLQQEFKFYEKADFILAKFVMRGDTPQVEIAWKGMSLRVGTLVGDIVHNMRAALDLAAAELARKFSGNDKGVYFPFSVDLASLPAAIKSKSFDKCGSAANSILYQLEPYRGGMSGLRSIHDLDIQDKHQALIPHHKAMKIKLSGSYNEDDPLNTGTVSVVSAEVEHLFPVANPVLGGGNIEKSLIGFADLLDSILNSFEPLLT